ncbi:MAG: tRNA glutamyl-Q(34) synthetase GluQRS [Pseudomonadota bacterium]
MLRCHWSGHFAAVGADREGVIHIDRFAPSPTGLLHLGHAFSALIGHAMAEAAGGRYLLRMEDLDRGRVRPEYYAAIEADLTWLGVRWHGDVLWQSQRLGHYAAALKRLEAQGLVYRCACTRRDIAEAVSAPQESRSIGPDGLVYPGTCRGRALPTGPDRAHRLDMRAAVTALGDARLRRLTFTEDGAGPAGETGEIALDPDALIEGTGDIVLARRDGTPAYHLAVVVDDAAQGITHITRGEDLFAATPIHRLLQALLGLPTPRYHHHRLIRDEAGRRLAKRDDAKAIATLRAEGASPDDIRRMVGLG